MIRLRIILFAALATASFAQTVDPNLYAGMRWRLIGPFRGGKATMVSGVPGNPAVYYIGTAGSGVWKTVDGGQVWTCVSDDVRLTGIGAVAVAPSRPDTVYVGASAGPTAGLYRSTDAGAHWDLVALQGHAVSSIVIDPHNPDLVMAAAGDTGVMRTADGGKTWKSVLPDAQMGGVWLVFDPDNPNNVYAGTRPAGGGGRGGGGGGRGAAPVMTPATDSQIYRSTDEGVTWKKTSPAGLPGGNFGTIALAVAPGTNGLRVYDYVAQGMFRSDDGGEHWTRATDDPRLIGGGQFHDVIVDPRDANILFATQTSLYRSTDAGKTWESYIGAPSGGDFNYVWIDPTNDSYMILAVDQGTGVSMDAGRTWTTWFNQPTGQMYNVTTDHGFPFFMYSAQQDSGTIATPIFGRGGQITYRDWYTTNGFESAKIVPDPADPNYLYATGWYGSILRVNKITGQTQHIFERTAKYRESGSPPMGFSPLDPHTFYLATQYLLATHDKGMHWESAESRSHRRPRRRTEPAPAGGRGGRGGRGRHQFARVFAQGCETDLGGHKQWPHPIDARWRRALEQRCSVRSRSRLHLRAGRLAQRPRARFRNCRGRRLRRRWRRWTRRRRSSPAHLSHRRLRQDLEDRQRRPAQQRGARRARRPGESQPGFRRARNRRVRFLQRRRSLAVAAAESARRVLPRSRHRAEHSDRRDLWPRLMGHRRSQSSARAGREIGADRRIERLPLRARARHPHAVGHLHRHALESRYGRGGESARWRGHRLLLEVAARGRDQLEVYDSAGKLVRAYSSSGAASLGLQSERARLLAGPASVLPKDAGLHRFVWDLRYPDPDQLLYTYYGIHVNYFEYTLADHAIPHNTPWHEPQGPMVLPGQYQIVLTVAGQKYRQPITVKFDPRLTYSTQELQRNWILRKRSPPA